MARFYADIQGNRGEATRMGTAGSGISAHPRGWNIGVKVDGYPSIGDSGRDEFAVRMSAGSNGGGVSVPLATVRETADGKRMVRVFAPDGVCLGEFTV
jgi:hypothetical protein